MVQIVVFTNSDQYAHSAINSVTAKANKFLEGSQPEDIVSVTPQILEYTDNDGDYPRQYWRYTVTIVYKAQE